MPPINVGQMKHMSDRYRIALRIGIGLVSLQGLLCCGGATRAGATFRPISLDMSQGLVTSTMTINGKPAEVLIDTGASMSFLRRRPLGTTKFTDTNRWLKTPSSIHFPRT